MSDYVKKPLKEFFSTVAFDDMRTALADNFNVACTPIKNNEFFVLTMGNRTQVKIEQISSEEELKDFTMLKMPPKPMEIPYGELLKGITSHKTLLFLSLKVLLGGRSADFITDPLVDVDRGDGVIVFDTTAGKYLIEIKPLLTPIPPAWSNNVRDKNPTAST